MSANSGLEAPKRQHCRYPKQKDVSLSKENLLLPQTRAENVTVRTVEPWFPIGGSHQTEFTPASHFTDQWAACRIWTSLFDVSLCLDVGLVPQVCFFFSPALDGLMLTRFIVQEG